jgi:hypothetical protein
MHKNNKFTIFFQRVQLMSLKPIEFIYPNWFKFNPGHKTKRFSFVTLPIFLCTIQIYQNAHVRYLNQWVLSCTMYIYTPTVYQILREIKYILSHSYNRYSFFIFITSAI